MKSELLILLLGLMFDVSAADQIKTKTEYIYQSDNEGYENHRVVETASYNDYEVYYQHNETTHQTEFWYDQTIFSKRLKIYDVNATVGLGAIYGQEWSAIPAYAIDLQKNNLNLSISRNAVAASQFNQDSNTAFSKNYADDITLSYDINVNKQYTIVVGGTLSEFDNNNQRKGVFLKNIYDINDNVSVQMHNKILYYTDNVQQYFSPAIYETHKLLLNYSRPLLNENVVFKFSAGPSLVNIDSRREIVPFYDVKVIYNTEKVGKYSIGYSCLQTTYEYTFCQLGGNVQINF